MTSAVRPILSICIPSYNRSSLLLSLLQEMDRPDFLPFDFEVVVCDNASPDPGYAAIAEFRPEHYGYAYFRRSTNIGGAANIGGCYRLASAEFCLHLSDDDRLISSEVAAIVARMQDDPQIQATFAGFEDYERIGGRLVNGRGFEEGSFTQDNAPGIVDMLNCGRLAIPELAIYRSMALGSALFASAFAYFPYRVIERLLPLGVVRFQPQIYYTGIAQHSGETERHIRTSDDFGMAGWSSVGRGFALLCQAALGKPLYDLAETPEQRLFLTLTRNAFVDANNHARFFEALELMEYLICLGAGALFSDDERTHTREMGYLDAIRLEIEKLPGVTTAHLIGLGDAGGTLSQMFLGHRSSVAVVKSASVMEVDPSHAAFVTPSDAMREQLISLFALRPGFVFSLEAVRRAFSL